MNNPKLTNGLLIAVIALNFIFLIGSFCKSMHHHHHNMYAGLYEGRRHFGSFGRHSEGYYGGIGNHMHFHHGYGHRNMDMNRHLGNQG